MGATGADENVKARRGQAELKTAGPTDIIQLLLNAGAKQQVIEVQRFSCPTEESEASRLPSERCEEPSDLSDPRSEAWDLPARRNRGRQKPSAMLQKRRTSLLSDVRSLMASTTHVQRLGTYLRKKIGRTKVISPTSEAVGRAS